MIDVALGSLDFGKPVASERVLATLLFTDIVGSTPLAERLGDDASKRVLADHDRIIAAAIERIRGRRVQTTGDGVFARFDGAARALQAGLAIRDALRGNELEVRIGIHTGEIEIAGEETRGLAIHEAARIMALANGSEILISDLTRQLATGAGFAFEDRGEVELRGVSRTRRIFALESSGGA